MRISDWSSDVCSSDLIRGDLQAEAPAVELITGLKRVYAFEFFEQDMVGVKGYDAAILEALKRHKTQVVAKTSNANTITHYPKGAAKAVRSEERRVGKEWVRTCSTRWASDSQKKKTPQIHVNYQRI